MLTEEVKLLFGNRITQKFFLIIGIYQMKVSQNLIIQGITPISSMKTKFSGSICWTFCQYSVLKFWTLSVFPWLLRNVFFLLLVFVFAMHDTLYLYLPNYCEL